MRVVRDKQKYFYYYFKDIYDVLDALFAIESQSVIEDVKEGASFMRNMPGVRR